MVAEGQNYFTTDWWVVTFPGLAILITAFAFNLLGDGLRDLLDPEAESPADETGRAGRSGPAGALRGTRRVVQWTNSTLAAAEIVGLAGESGSGKSMTTLAVLGLAAHRRAPR